MRLTPPLEFRSSPSGEIAGYASTFMLDAYRSRILPGAFQESLAAHRAAGTAPAMLWSHDHTRPIGVWKSFEEDARGLLVRGKLLLDTAGGAEAFALVKGKATTGLSVGMVVEANDVEHKKDEVHILRAELHEISVTPIPANPGARITDIRSLERPSDLESLLREAGLSKSQARGVVSRGWSALQDPGGERSAAAIQDLMSNINRRAAGMDSLRQKWSAR